MACVMSRLKQKVFLCLVVLSIILYSLSNRLTARKIKKHTFLSHLPLKVILAHFSQTTIPESLAVSSYPETQCCITAMIALLAFQQISPEEWTQNILNEVILAGDKLHSDWIKTTGKTKFKDKRIAVDELPATFLSRGRCYEIRQGKIQYGSIDMTTKTATDFKLNTFSKALDYCMSKRFQGALLTIQDKTMALFNKKGFVYLCDSHGYDSLGKPVRNGQAILAKFVNCQHFVCYITHREKPSSLFNLVPFNIKETKRKAV